MIYDKCYIDIKQKEIKEKRRITNAKYIKLTIRICFWWLTGRCHKKFKKMENTQQRKILGPYKLYLLITNRLLYKREKSYQTVTLDSVMSEWHHEILTKAFLKGVSDPINNNTTKRVAWTPNPIPTRNPFTPALPMPWLLLNWVFFWMKSTGMS